MIERLHRVRRDRGGRTVAAEIPEIGGRCASLPDLDRRTTDEILDYDERGLLGCEVKDLQVAEKGGE